MMRGNEGEKVSFASNFNCILSIVLDLKKKKKAFWVKLGHVFFSERWLLGFIDSVSCLFSFLDY